MDVTGTNSNSEPYRRKMIFFENTTDKQGNEVVKVKKIQEIQ